VTMERERSVTDRLLMLIGLLLVCLMPTAQSVWIDESTTALLSREPSLRSFVVGVRDSTSSDSQMPIGNLYFWAGSRVVGSSEIGLRVLSCFWVAVGVVILWRVGVVTQTHYLPILFVCNAFAWYYAGEARPYAMQIGLGAGLLYAMVMVVSTGGSPRHGFLALLVCGPILCGTSMLAVIPVGLVTGVIVLSLLRQEWRPQFADWLMAMASLGFTLVLGLYYTWTLVEGKGAQTVGKWGVGLKNILFAAYELLGFSGFGPGRYTLRQLSIDSGVSTALNSLVQLPWAAGLASLALLYLWAGLRLVRRLRSDRSVDAQTVLLTVLVTVCSVGALHILSVAASFPFWGRHLAPLLPARREANAG
jgi:hypothetical protein